MSLSDTILNKAGELLGAASPIELFNANQVKKLLGPTVRASEFIGASFGIAKSNVERAIGNMGKPGYAGIGHYFEGYNIGDKMSDIAANTVALRRRQRQLLATGAVVYGGAQIMGGLASRGANTALGVAMHGTIAAGLGKLNPVAGGIYAGWGAYNLTRPGDNTGPF